ncbi:glycoside hydrolase [Maribacter sp. ANRC-HE7]|uniref:Glycoside hydrolase n=1 Tax=Maribacter aquimaris TaxID=2737171 RepID=A0ABR7V314_9FLAO|nr:glycoside hydrolase family 31 protein [Maribacter aquimaris]MBD0777557.1 glycoside hydrolase [Maribacter aquimaris]
MKKILLISLLLVTTYNTYSQNKEKIEIVIQQGEYWWGGLSSIGHNTPYDSETIESHDLWGDNKGNQAQPLLLSSKGRYVWSESPIKYSFDKGKITVTSRDGKIEFGTAGQNLRDSYEYAVANFFPPNGKIPEKLLFTKPQYNTWIELIYNQNEEDILKYAQAIIDKGYPPGVLMIDDNWQESYGTWEFSPRRFKDPKGMMKKLHGMGFKVMLWVCPFVSADTETFRHLAKEKMLLLDADKTQDILWADTKNKAAIFRWWNGASACLDLSNPDTQEWFEGRLKYLMDEYGVDGFKFDAGDAGFYTEDIVSYVPGMNPNDHTTYFAKLGLQFPLNEYRASWKMAGLPLAQRLRDKLHVWTDLEKLIPDLMSQSLMGYAYTCPDMIGGGEHQSFENTTTIDEELVVRSAQVHALMPMMQFSVAPWRVLSEENNQFCLEAALLHAKMGSLFLELAEEASRTGEPIVKPMALAYPNNGYETIKDQFMLGNHILVAPVVKNGERKRKVILPKGKWVAENGKTFRGGRTIEIDVPLSRLPYFTKK